MGSSSRILIGEDMDQTWQEFLERERQLPYFKTLEKFIEEEYQTTTVHPNKDDIYSAFALTPFNEVKVVILGQDPYHNHNQAHGLAFSVLKGNKIPPSLLNIYKELHHDLGVEIPSHGDLTSWAKQGVFLLNTILTVKHNLPLSHKGKGWEIFTNHVMEELNKDNQPKVFVLWGNNAKLKRKLISNPNHSVLVSSHPSPLSARHSFFGSNVFSKINHILEAHGRAPIDFKIK